MLQNNYSQTRNSAKKNCGATHNKKPSSPSFLNKRAHEHSVEEYYSAKKTSIFGSYNMPSTIVLVNTKGGFETAVMVALELTLIFLVQHFIGVKKA
jgi:hypothetical protein